MIDFSSSVLGIFLAVYLFVQWLLEALLGERPKIKSLLKFVSGLGAIGSLGVALVAKNEAKEQQVRDLQSRNEVLNLKLENKDLKNTVTLLRKDLSDEKNRIKSFSAFVQIEFSGTWDESNKPFTTDVIANYIQDTEIMSLYYDSHSGVPPVEMRLVEKYWYPSFSNNRASFMARIAPKASSHIFNSNPEDLKKLVEARIQLPLLRWLSINKMPIKLDRALIQIFVNGDKQIFISKELPFWMIPEQFYATNSSQVFFEIPIKLDSKDVKLTKMPSQKRDN